MRSEPPTTKVTSMRRNSNQNQHYDPNPARTGAGDCVVRAICKAENKDWGTIYMDLSIEGMALGELPNANTCYKLAAYYIILNEMRGKTPVPPLQTYSQDPPGNTVHFDSDSEFAQAIQGMDSDRAWAIVDDLVATLWAVNKPLYNALMRQIKA